MGGRGSATVISQVICQTCWSTEFPQAGLWTPRSSRTRRRRCIYMLLDVGGNLLVTIFQLTQLQENSVW